MANYQTKRSGMTLTDLLTGMTVITAVIVGLCAANGSGSSSQQGSTGSRQVDRHVEPSNMPIADSIASRRR